MVIETDHLTLKPISQDALPALARLLTDEIVGRTYMVPDFADKKDAQVLAQRLMVMSEGSDRFVAGIYLGDQLIGMINETDKTAKSIELGYAILPQYHNRGFATEAMRGAIEHFLRLGFQQVIAGAFEENIPSIRVMLKCGMTLLPQRDEITYRGKTHNCIYYCARKEGADLP